MAETTGWLLDLHENASGGITLWFITEKEERLRLVQNFDMCFYVAGSAQQLIRVEQFLKTQPISCQSNHEQRRDLYLQALRTVLAVRTQPVDFSRLFKQTNIRFPQLEFYDADISIQLRHAAQYGTFPLALCRIMYQQNQLTKLEIMEQAWVLDPVPPPLRILRIEPDCDPRYKLPYFLEVTFGNKCLRYFIGYTQSSLVRIATCLRRYDPDLILTKFGDTWLLPFLLSAARQEHITLPLNRELKKTPLLKKEGSYLSYGRFIYRGQQVLLYGRCHIDCHNAMLWQEYELESVLEMARVTSLPIQTAARASPGTGINSMEIRTALRQNILVPWHKTHGEETKTAVDLLRADQGGLVYQPIAGVHEDVGMIDFISLYPSIMTYCNISPEKPIPQHLELSQDTPGLIPQTLRPLLEKRIALKQRAAAFSPDDPRQRIDKTRSAALKMLLVCCFGYLGYKAAKFGRIESHEAISALGREALLTAKEAAEDLGFSVLHLYVDGLWVRKENTSSPKDYTPLLEEIARRTSLPIALDAIYRWVAFLPSQSDPRMSVPNRYFGLKQDGTLTVRGVDIRKHDTSSYIARFQQTLIARLSQLNSTQEIISGQLDLLNIFKQYYRDLKHGGVRMEDLVVHKRVTRELDAYHVATATALAARQLDSVGQTVRLGQRVPFIYTLGSPGVTAWHINIPISTHNIHYAYYRILLLRAASMMLQPFGITRAQLLECIDKNIVSDLLFPDQVELNYLSSS